MQLTILPSGLRVASREMPGIETAAVGLYAIAFLGLASPWLLGVVAIPYDDISRSNLVEE